MSGHVRSSVSEACLLPMVFGVFRSMFIGYFVVFGGLLRKTFSLRILTWRCGCWHGSLAQASRGTQV